MLSRRPEGTDLELALPARCGTSVSPSFAYMKWRFFFRLEHVPVPFGSSVSFHVWRLTPVMWFRSKNRPRYNLLGSVGFFDWCRRDRKATRHMFGDSRNRRLSLEPLEARRVLAFVGLGVNLFEDVGGAPGDLIADDTVSIGQTFFAEITVEAMSEAGDVDDIGNPIDIGGVFSLNLNLFWDPVVLEALGPPMLVTPPGFTALSPGILDNDVGSILAASAGNVLLDPLLGVDGSEGFYTVHFRAESAATESMLFAGDSGGLSGELLPDATVAAFIPDPFFEPVTVLGGSSAVVNINGPMMTEGTGGTTNYSFEVTLTESLASEVSVDFAVTGGSALQDNDYTVITTGPIVFSSGDTVQTIDLIVDADSTVELDETIVVELSNVVITNDSAAIAGPDAVLGDSSGTGRITNDDSAEIRISETTVSANEGVGLLGFVVELTNPVDVDVSVDFSTSDDSATPEDSDYVAANHTLTFLAGQSGPMTVPVTVMDDNKVELNETLDFAINNLVGQAGRDVTIGTSSATGEIVNDDTAKLTIMDVANNEGNIGENPVFSFVVMLDNPVDTETSVQFATSDGTAEDENGDGDYQSNSGTLTFAAGSTTSQTIDVTGNGDEDSEATETFTVNLSNLQDGGRSVVLDAMATGTLVADDPAIFIDDVTLAEGNSGETMFEFTVMAMGLPTGPPIEVVVNTQDGTATAANSDYVPVENLTLMFDDQEPTQTVTVLVNGDIVVEDDEIFSVIITTNAVGIALTDNTGEGAITNDDVAELAVESVTVTEGNSGTVDATFNVTLNAPIDVSASVLVATLDGTAHDESGDGDYVAASQTFTFPANDISTQMFTVTVNGDNIVEPMEVFGVTLDNLSASGRNVSLRDGIGTIENDDAASISINHPTVVEGDHGTTTTLTFTVTLDDPVDVPVSVLGATSDGTAQNENGDGDYIAASQTITFPANDTSPQTFIVTVSGDSRIESDETLSMVLGDPAAEGRDVTLGNGTGTGTIENDDDVAIVIDDLQVSEGGSDAFTVDVTIRLTGEVDVPVTVDFEADDGSARVADGDYFANSGFVTFQPGSTSEVVSMTIQDDNKFETDETLTITLSNLDAGNSGVTIQDAEATLTVNNDDDVPSIMIDSVLIQEPENGTVAATFTVSLSNPSSETVTVDFATQDVSAEDENGDDDYRANSGTLTFVGDPTNTIQQTVTVQVNTDDVDEGIETFRVVLSNAQGGTIVQGSNDGIGTISEDAGTASLHGRVTFGTSAFGIPGVPVTLQSVNLATPITILTDAGGFYSFDGLFGDSYEIVQGDLSDLFVDGPDVIGTQGGDTENDRFFNIDLNANEVGTDNTFTESSLQSKLISKRLLLNSTPPPEQFLADLINSSATQSSTNSIAAGPSAGISGIVSPQVVIDQETVTVLGTDGYDEFEFEVSTDQLTITVNQEIHTLAAGQVSHVNFVGGGGGDSATLTGGVGDELLELSPQSANFSNADSSYFVEVSGVDRILVDGGGGNNTAILFDSIGNDLLQIQPNLASLSADQLVNQVVNFDLVRAVSSAAAPTC